MFSRTSNLSFITLKIYIFDNVSLAEKLSLFIRKLWTISANNIVTQLVNKSEYFRLVFTKFYALLTLKDLC